MRQLLFGVLAILFFHQQAAGVTGDITGHTVWNTGGSPYSVTGDIRVMTDDTLEIQAGVTVRFSTGSDDQAGGNSAALCEILVDSGGVLLVTGAAGDSVVLESDAGTPDYGDWHGIMAGDGCTIDLRYCVITHPYYGFYCIGEQSGAVTVRHTRIHDTYNPFRVVNVNGAMAWSVDSCRIIGTQHRGFYLQNVPTLAITGCILDSMADHGIYMSGTGMDSTVLVTGNSISHVYNVGDYGIYLDNARPTITGNVITDCYGGMQINVFDDDYEYYHPISGNTVTGGTNGITMTNYASPTFRNNNWYGQSGYQMYNSSSRDIDARQNYWGTAATDEMNAGGNPKDITGIYDHYESILRGTVNYAGWLDTLDGSPVYTTMTGEAVFTDGAGAEQFAYGQAETAWVQVTDTDMDRAPGTAETVTVEITSGVETVPELLTLTETGISTGVFSGYILIDSSGTAAEDGMIQTVTDDQIDVDYYDAATEYGDPDTIYATVLYGVTLVSGAVTGHGTWGAANTPYLVTGDILVESGDTLTIEPGVHVYFVPGDDDQAAGSNTDLCEIYVDGGALIANGTKEAHITFTSKTAAPAMQDWEAIYVNGSGTARLAFCDLSYANYPLRLNLTDTDSIVVRNCSMADVNRALYMYGTRSTGRVVLADNHITDTDDIAVYMHTCRNVELTGSRIDSTGGLMAVNVYDAAEPGTTVVISGNTFTSTGNIKAISLRNAQPLITENNIENFNIGIYIDGATYHTEPLVTYNTFVDCKTALQLENDAAPVINHNNINAQESWQVYNNTVNDIDATGNWWGQEATDSMKVLGTHADMAGIYDSLDNGSLGRVDYSGWLTDLVPVTLSSFSAEQAGAGALVCWTTESEVNCLGYNVLRSASAEGDYLQVNNTLIAGGGGVGSAVYQFADTDVPAGTWYYMLEQKDLNGATALAGPVTVTVEVTGIGRDMPVPGVIIDLNTAVLFDLNGIRVQNNHDLKAGIHFVRQEGRWYKVMKVR